MTGNAARTDDPVSNSNFSILLRRESLQFLSSHYHSAAKGAALGLAAGALYLYAAGPVFTARAQLLIDPSIQSILREPSPFAAPASMDSPQVETEIAVLRSEEIAKAVAQKFKIVEDREYRVTNWVDFVPAWLVSPETLARADQDKLASALDKFRSNLLVRRIGVSYAVDIFFTSRDPDRAAQIANALADSYMRTQLDARANAARLGSQWLEARLSELRQEMNGAARKMQEFRASQNYSLAKGGTETAAAPPPKTSVKAEARAAEALTLEELESTAVTYRRTYETLLQSLVTAVQRQSFPIANARVITTASPPLTQSRHTGLILLLTTMAGALAMLGWKMLPGTRGPSSS